MYLQKTAKPLKKMPLLCTLLLLLIFNASITFADFYVIAGSRGVGTKINSLPYTISSSGFYFIDKDLSCATGSHGITITADHVTLDLMGFSLVGPAGALTHNGIHMNGRTNVEIRNGTIRNFPNFGIGEIDTGGKGHRIINLRTQSNISAGISVAGNSHLIKECSSAGNGGNGIYAAAYGCTITGNTCYDNGYHGINANTGSTVTGNTCYSNGITGVNTDACTVTGNTCYDNDNNGISSSGGSTITGNTCYDNHSGGMYAGTGAAVIGNTCRSNSGYGIFLAGENFVDQNTAYLNTTANISDCASCTFVNNHAPAIGP